MFYCPSQTQTPRLPVDTELTGLIWYPSCVSLEADPWSGGRCRADRCHKQTAYLGISRMWKLEMLNIHVPGLLGREELSQYCAQLWRLTRKKAGIPNVKCAILWSKLTNFWKSLSASPHSPLNMWQVHSLVFSQLSQNHAFVCPRLESRPSKRRTDWVPTHS